MNCKGNIYGASMTSGFPPWERCTVPLFVVFCFTVGRLGLLVFRMAGHSLFLTADIYKALLVYERNIGWAMTRCVVMCGCSQSSSVWGNLSASPSVACVPAHPLVCRALFARSVLDWKGKLGGQALTSRRAMKKFAANLASVGASRLCEWGPRDEDCRWLETLTEMAQDQPQWSECPVAYMYSSSS